VIDPELNEVMRGFRWKGDIGEPGPACLGDDTLAALVDGNLDPPARGEAMMHLAQCGYCRSSVASLARALGDPAVAAATLAVDRTPGRRFVRLAAPAAAAAVLLFAILGRQGTVGRPSEIHRAPAISAVDQPVAISPLGAGARPEWLRWGAVVGADRYRVTLFHADGRVLYVVELRDTAAALPDSIGLIPGSSYLWMVEARTGWDRWSSSRLFQFAVSRDAAP
jgi:anti-sigma factor RsiW